jgi:hypothetical protein
MDILKGHDHLNKKNCDFWRKNTEVPRDMVDHPEQEGFRV